MSWLDDLTEYASDVVDDYADDLSDAFYSATESLGEALSPAEQSNYVQQVSHPSAGVVPTGGVVPVAYSPGVSSSMPSWMTVNNAALALGAVASAIAVYQFAKR